VQPVRALRGARLHVDATQAAGKLDLRDLDADAIVWSAHKLGGPVGVGALSLRDGGPFPALFAGAQERGRRGGTVNVAGAVGFAAACRLALAEHDERRERHAALAARLRAEVQALGGIVLGAEPVPAITYAVFDDLRGETLVQALDLEGVAVSAGSACASGSTVLSPLVRALAPDHPGGGVRISLGPRTTAADIDGFLAALARVLPVARAAARWERELSSS
jgi:cysteine desulfurase